MCINNMIQIEKANLNDLKNIQQLNQLLFIKEKNEYDGKFDENWPFLSWGEEYFKKQLTQVDRIIFVAKEGDKVIGYIAGVSKMDHSLCDQPTIVELDNMLVMDDYRGQGIGSELVKKLKDWAKEKDAARMIVLANHKNDKGINFYKKHGFEDYLVELKMEL